MKKSCLAKVPVKRDRGPPSGRNLKETVRHTQSIGIGEAREASALGWCLGRGGRGWVEKS